MVIMSMEICEDAMRQTSIYCDLEISTAQKVGGKVKSARRES